MIEKSDVSFVGNDARGSTKMYYGDAGVVDTTTDNFNIKLGYDFGNWSGLVAMSVSGFVLWRYRKPVCELGL